MDDCINTILEYPKLKEYLDQNPDQRKNVLKNIQEIRGNFNPNLVRGAIKFIDATFGKLYDGVNLEVPKGFDMAELVQDYNVILVPNHQSHADYIALTYTMFGVYEIPIYIAAGINLNIFPIGKFFANTGAFFIRRKFKDDEAYKFTFAAYVYYLIKTGKVVEFFFEGGRSRTGKLMPPKFGLFSMLLEAHQELLKVDPNAKPLLFVPVALAHEQIPEGKALARELGGAQKEAESTKQLLKVFKIFKKKLGTIHVRISKPFEVKEIPDIKECTQKLAFDCFNQIAKEMPVTPSSLLSMVLLDEPAGALSFKQIKKQCFEIIEHCKKFHIPITPSLNEEEAEISIRKALDVFVSNKKIDVINRKRLGETFYGIKDESRVELLYAKNMILHHFIVPGFINAVWLNIFRGEIKTGKGLTKFLLQRRKELKYEFYLPTAREMIQSALDIVEYGTGKKMDSLEGALHLDSKELYKIADKVKRFSTAFAHIYEAYFIAATAVKYLDKQQFTMDKFTQTAKELFEMEIDHGQIIKYRESFTVPKMKGAMSYFVNQKAVEVDNGLYSVTNMDKIDYFIEKFVADLGDQISISLKLEHESKRQSL